jgi:hypothetical protein
VQLEGPEKEWLAGTELGLLRAYHVPGHVTASHGSVGTGTMGAGFVWSWSKSGSERIGREEEGTNSGRAEMGAYAAILRRTPDHEDLVTPPGEQMGGARGKATLANTADADILEYILTKLAARIAAKSRTFLVKVKAHRGEPLNEGADDLAETGRTMEKEGDNYRWKARTARLVYPSILRQERRTMEKRHMDQNHTERGLEGRRNLGWKSACSLEQTSGGRGCFKVAARTWSKTSYRLIRTGDLTRPTNGI